MQNKIPGSLKLWNRLPSEQVVVPKHHFYCATAMISPQFPDPPKQLPDWFLHQAKKNIFNNLYDSENYYLRGYISYYQQ
jgi:hypothetical protein